jgi:YD repeat-containing protein
MIGGAANQNGVATVYCPGVFVQVSASSPGGVILNQSSTYLDMSTGVNTFTYSTPSVVSKPETITFEAIQDCCGAHFSSPTISVVPNSISLTFSPSSMVGEGQTSGTVALQYPTYGSVEVHLSPACCVAHLTSSATIPAGQTTATFPVTGSVQSTTQQVDVTALVVANDGYITDTNSITVLPPQADLGPCTKHCDEMAGSPINVVNGDVWVQQKDYALPGTGGGMQLARTWNSLWASSQPPASAGIFGQGWMSTYEERLTWPLDGVIYYWRGDGSYWCFAQGTVPGSYTLISPADERASLQYQSGLYFTLTLKDGSTRVFSANGYLLSITDRNGNQTVVQYSGSNIATVTDPAGRTLTFNYANASTPNQVSSIQDTAGTIASYVYDAKSNLTHVTYADGSSATMTYDGSGQITSITDGSGRLLEAHTYDSSRRGLSSNRANGVDAISLAGMSLRQ